MQQLNYDRFYRFCLLIDGIHKNINRLKIDLAPDLGVKSVHIFWVYELLLHEDGLTAAELASKTMISRSLISREIEDLYELGYIDMCKTAHGKRKNYNSRIYLTEKGKDLAKSISDLGNQIQFAADKNITEEELSSFYSTLEKLSENLLEISQLVDVSCKGSVSNTMKTE
ncbi:MAG: winged helix-turn-helix transcriptional regulator [Clostridia bacterium]|nr:winged helix-turn-helix transcriptional regulator [Clostridia bacterium]